MIKTLRRAVLVAALLTAVRAARRRGQESWALFVLPTDDAHRLAQLRRSGLLNHRQLMSASSLSIHYGPGRFTPALQRAAAVGEDAVNNLLAACSAQIGPFVPTAQAKALLDVPAAYWADQPR